MMSSDLDSRERAVLSLENQTAAIVALLKRWLPAR